MADVSTDITKQKHMSFKEIAAYSLGLFGFQAIVGLLNSYQAEFDSSILGADIAVVGILILVAKIISAVADPVVGYFYKTYLLGVPQDLAKTLAKIGAITTSVNAVIAVIVASIIYLALRPAMKKLNMLRDL